MKPIILYQKTHTGKTQQWKIWVESKGNSGSPEVWIEHGQTGGKKQLTHDVIQSGVNQGKANATTSLEQALLSMERKITKQKEKGYVENLSDVQSSRTLDLTKPFPKELCFYKPKNSIDEKKLKQLEQEKRALYTVKRNGMMHVLAAYQSSVEIYSRRMDLVTDLFPHITSSCSCLPAGTVLLGEMVYINKDGTDDFNIVSRICRSDSEAALHKQNEFGRIKFYIFDVAFFNGKNLLCTKPYIERRVVLGKLVDKMSSDYIMASEVIAKPHTVAMKEVCDRKLEGLVIFDALAIMEEKRAFTFNGKAERPSVLWKSKPKYEDDFIVRFDPEKGIGEYGTGKNFGKMKSVFCYQIENEKEVFLAKCGGGLTDDQRDYYSNKRLYPRVWCVEFDSVQPGTGSLRFPVFSRDRTEIGDKEIQECQMSDDIRNARDEEEDENE